MPTPVQILLAVVVGLEIAIVAVAARTNSAGTCPHLSAFLLTATCQPSKLNNHSSDYRDSDASVSTDAEGWRGPLGCVEEWCLWTKANFGGGGVAGRGIAVITQATNMKRVRAICRAAARNEVSSASSLSSSPLERDGTFHVAPVPGKGKGVVASREIKRGELLMEYTPVLVVQRAFLDVAAAAASDNTGSSRRHQQLLDAAVAALPRGSRELFSALSKGPLDYFASSSSSSSSLSVAVGGHAATAAMLANSFQVQLPPAAAASREAGDNEDEDEDNEDRKAAAMHYATYPEIARFNHDCRPNAAFHINATTLLQRVFAVAGFESGVNAFASADITSGTPIVAGDEITISYVDIMAPAAERKAGTQAAWGFKCTCMACRDVIRPINNYNSASSSPIPPSPSTTTTTTYSFSSDARLAEIASLESHLLDIGTGTSIVNATTIERVLQLYVQERLEARMFGVLTLAALNYNLLGQAEAAVRYARLAADAGAMEAGEGAGDVVAMRMLAADPKAHFTWRRRLEGGMQGI